jgi:LPXTG-motif cell wall-anchored protein
MPSAENWPLFAGAGVLVVLVGAAVVLVVRRRPRR